jgi:polyhydroxyalkanoate synthesis regulator phasin
MPEARDWDETSMKAAMGWKLRKMVAKGLLTAEQAREKMAAWMAKAAGKKAALEDGTSSEDTAALRKKLRMLVAKGGITREEAREKMAAWRAKAKITAAKLEDGTPLEAKKAFMKLREMVAKGEIPKREAVRKLRMLIGQGMITREEARAKIAAWQASAPGPAANGEDESMAETLLASKLSKMVAKGEMTSEDARLKLAIRKKVMNGEITREQAMAAWEAKAAPALAAKAEDTTSDSADALASKLNKMAEKGDMTPEQADIKTMLHKTIAKGSITMAQARAKMAAFQAKAADTVVV